MSIWQGKILDCAGASGTVEIDSPDNSGPATWRLLLSTRDGQPNEIKGEFTIDGKLGEGEAVAKGEEKLPNGAVATWSLTLSATSAGNYAKSALAGQYTLSSQDDKIPLPVSRGVLVLWLFE